MTSNTNNTKRRRKEQQQQDNHNNNIGRYIPADLLLLRGTVIVNEATLTGECEPQRKEAIVFSSSSSSSSSMNEVVLDLNQEDIKRSLVFGGTILLHHSNHLDDDEEQEYDSIPTTTNGNHSYNNNNNNKKNIQHEIPSPPDGGCIFFVLRTGFDSLQGSLLRTMVHSTSKSSSSSSRGDPHDKRDTFIFIALLLLCALGSSLFILQAGWNDMTRNRFKLLIHVIIILTSVVPPELPMELSLAVTHSLTDLIRRCKVYCTEPARIPLAGMVTTCCFDKTGTLTSDDMRFIGVILPKNMMELCAKESTPTLIQNVLDLPLEVQQILVTCHSLSSVERGSEAELIGDPMEKAMFRASGWSMSANDTTINPPAGSSHRSIKVKHRFSFESKIRRMSVLVNHPVSVHLYTKGAPETMKDLLVPDSMPSNYDVCYRRQMQLGRRVLAMASRELRATDLSYGDVSKARNKMEKDLKFAGFLVFDSPLKADSAKVIKNLSHAGLEIVMITGDALLTSVEVARRVGIVSKHNDVYEIRASDSTEMPSALASYRLFPIHRSGMEQYPSNSGIALPSMHSMTDFDLCVSGDTMQTLTCIDPTMVSCIKIFARHTPRQKEDILSLLNASGRVTLMCGDGTNDVGALKKATIGISIVSVPEVERTQREVKQKSLSNGGNPKRKNLAHLHKLLMEADDEISHVNLGFASVASPFTARTTSIKCVEDILLRGRCTIASMHQIYKILGINCLINAYQLTVLHLLGVKSGDYQLTASGILVAVLFLLVSKGEPLENLSVARTPPKSVLSIKILLSIVLQFSCHCISITLVALVTQRYVDPLDSISTSDGSFYANILNTTTYLVSLAATVSTFFINYQGRPYMKALNENKLLLRCLQFCLVFIAMLVIELLPPINEMLQLVPLPTGTALKEGPLTILHPIHDVENHAIRCIEVFGFNMFLCTTILIDCGAAYILDRWITS